MINLSKRAIKLAITVSVAALILIVPLAFAYLGNRDAQINSIQDVVSKCKNNGTLSSVSSCVVEVTSSFYKYNLDNAGKDLSFSQLKDQGGVCSSWSDYYNEIGQDFGFSTQNVIVPVQGNVYHEFNVWSNDSGYCILDQTNVKCTPLN